MSGTIRVGLLFGDPLVREGRRMLLATQPQFEVVWEESDGFVASESLADAAVEVVLVDNRLKTLSGSESIRRFIRRNLGRDGKLPAFVLTGPFNSVPMSLEAIRCGASDFVSEEETAEEIFHALQDAGSLEKHVDFAALQEFFEEAGVEHGSNQRWVFRLNNLNEIEQRVFEALANATSDQSLAQDTELTVTRIGWILDSFQEKLGVVTRSQLALALHEAGILPPVFEPEPEPVAESMGEPEPVAESAVEPESDAADDMAAEPAEEAELTIDDLFRD
jgi:DNA-binding NarL/FixJ family response regulator